VSSIPVVYLASAALEPPLPSATIGCCQDFHRGVLLTRAVVVAFSLGILRSRFDRLVFAESGRAMAFDFYMIAHGMAGGADSVDSFAIVVWKHADVHHGGPSARHDRQARLQLHALRMSGGQHGRLKPPTHPNPILSNTNLSIVQSMPLHIACLAS
jgi:hypothetical protein